jgi:hypothetical protein
MARAANRVEAPIGGFAVRACEREGRDAVEFPMATVLYKKILQRIACNEARCFGSSVTILMRARAGSSAGPRLLPTTSLG